MWPGVNHTVKAVIDQSLCIQCGRCHIACEDTSHQSIAATRTGGKRRYEVIEAECVGCNLCYHACPVPNVITSSTTASVSDFYIFNVPPARYARLAATAGNTQPVTVTARLFCK